MLRVNGFSAFAVLLHLKTWFGKSLERARLPVDSFKTAFFSEIKPGFSKAPILTKRCAKIQGMENRDQGRIHSLNGKNRAKKARTENGSQKGGHSKGLSECESSLRRDLSRVEE
jgi:hypothetical protein